MRPTTHFNVPPAAAHTLYCYWPGPICVQLQAQKPPFRSGLTAYTPGGAKAPLHTMTVTREGAAAVTATATGVAGWLSALYANNQVAAVSEQPVLGCHQPVATVSRMQPGAATQPPKPQHVAPVADVPPIAEQTSRRAGRPNTHGHWFCSGRLQAGWGARRRGGGAGPCQACIETCLSPIA